MALHPRRPDRDILSVSFNQTGECFTCSLTSGFRIFVTYPLRESYRREFETGGIRLAEMLFKSNILAVVGGGEVPKYPPNKVIMWDDYQGRAIGELGFKTVVRNVKLRRDRIAVALEQKVLVYDLEDLRLVHQTETHSNLQGLLALCPSSDAIVLACPGLSIGQVRIDLLDTKRMKIIQAHNRNLACLSLTSNGKYVSTASEKGTLIRIFSTSDGSKIREVRRGTDPARIWSIAFSHEDMPHWLGVTSDKGTLHVFDLRGDEEDVEEGYQLVESTGASSTGSFSLLKSMLPVGKAYLASERSWSQFRLPDSCKCIVSFAAQHPGLVAIVSITGAYHFVEFNPKKKGPCSSISHSMFLGQDPVSCAGY